MGSREGAHGERTTRARLSWTPYLGLDPETNLGGAEFLTQGIDFFQNPEIRSFILSITLNR